MASTGPKTIQRRAVGTFRPAGLFVYMALAVGPRSTATPPAGRAFPKLPRPASLLIVTWDFSATLSPIDGTTESSWRSKGDSTGRE